MKFFKLITLIAIGIYFREFINWPSIIICLMIFYLLAKAYEKNDEILKSSLGLFGPGAKIETIFLNIDWQSIEQDICMRLPDWRGFRENLVKFIRITKRTDNLSGMITTEVRYIFNGEIPDEIRQIHPFVYVPNLSIDFEKENELNLKSNGPYKIHFLSILENLKVEIPLYSTQLEQESIVLDSFPSGDILNELYYMELIAKKSSRYEMIKFDPNLASNKFAVYKGLYNGHVFKGKFVEATYFVNTFNSIYSRTKNYDSSNPSEFQKSYSQTNSYFCSNDLKL